MKTQIFRLMICCFCLLCFITGCIREDFELPDEDKVVVGDCLPQFSVMLDDGHMFSPDSLKGRVLCLTFSIRYAVIVRQNFLYFSRSVQHSVLPMSASYVSVVKKTMRLFQPIGSRMG